MKLLTVSAVVTKSIFSFPHQSYILLPHCKTACQSTTLVQIDQSESSVL